MMRYGDTTMDRASDPHVVLDAVIDAIESPNPKTRYLIGHGARLQSLLRRLPDKVRDRVILGSLRRVAASSGGAEGRLRGVRADPAPEGAQTSPAAHG